MNANRIASLLAACALLFSAAALHAADDLSEIVNFREYSDLLSSSGQPSAEQLQAVSNAGFERVVFLAFSDHEHSLQHEDRIVKKLGMEYAQIPIDWEAPTKSDFYMFAGLMQRAPQNKTLVHCQVNCTSQLKPQIIDDFLASRPRERPRSYNHLLCTTRRLFDWLVDQGIRIIKTTEEPNANAWT